MDKYKVVLCLDAKRPDGYWGPIYKVKDSAENTIKMFYRKDEALEFASNADAKVSTRY